MELVSILQDLQLSVSTETEPHDGPSSPPITEVLDQLQQRLSSIAEKSTDQEATTVIQNTEQLFRKAQPGWLFTFDSTNQRDGLQNTDPVHLEKAYIGLVQSLTQWAALPLCEDDSGSLPASSYEGIPARALTVCSALSALLRSLGDWEAGRRSGSVGEREGRREQEPEGERGRETEAGLGDGAGTGAFSGPGATRIEADFPVSSIFSVKSWFGPEINLSASRFLNPESGLGMLHRAGGEMSFGLELGRGSSARQGPRRLSLIQRLAPLCCVFAVTHFQEQPWTSKTSRDAGSRLLVTLLRAGGWRNPPHLLMGDETEEQGRSTGAEVVGDQGRKMGVLGGILDVLQPELTKEQWQRCVAVKLVFSWSLLQVSRPVLSLHLSQLFPPSLLFSDHHRLDNRLLGVRCLHHIILNTPAADLRQYNRAEVLYHALFNHLYTNEAPLTQVVLACLLDLLPVLEKPPSNSSPSPRKPGRHDDVLRLVLTHMEMEHKVALRQVYTTFLPLYVDRMGIAISRHLKRVERVVTGYLEVGDAPEEKARLGILDALEKIIRIAWPRMESRVSVLLRSLLRLLVDVSSDSLLSSSVKDQLMDRTVRCLTLLDHCMDGKLQPLLQQVDGSCTSGPVLSCLETVTIATQR